jgi:hypothetical protein
MSGWWTDKGSTAINLFKAKEYLEPVNKIV